MSSFIKWRVDELINTVRQCMDPSLQILLYGDPSLRLESNVKVFECVHKYILDMERF